ncbi:MAG: ABC transporter substrate-binding protein [Dehalococcoidia bacterium]|nr:ABC transporter substrate-binding protein [Dehalococcoidia bacterium]
MTLVGSGSSPPEASRRGFLRISALATAATLGACAPVATPAPSTAPVGSTQTGKDAAWQEEWDKLVVAAKSEGKLTLQFIGAGTGYAKTGEAFQAAFPGIEVDVSNVGTGTLFLPKFWQERNAGVQNYDMIGMQAVYGIPELRDKKALVPIRPLIFHPEVLDDSKWVNGFEGGFVDFEKRWGYSGNWGERILLWYNTDLVKDGEIKVAKDLLDAKWKGKIAWHDAIHGATFWQATILRLTQGDEFVLRLFTEQEPQWVGRDDRLMTEGVIRGKYPIGRINPTILKDFRAQGLGNNVKPLQLADARLAAFDAPLWMPDKAPHPNAAKLFVNWLLSPQGQTHYAPLILQNSRRKDVPPADPESYIAPDKVAAFKYVFGDENELAESNKTIAMLQKLAR